MTNVLITGENSYIGVSVEKWLRKEPGKYTVVTTDMKDEPLNDKDFRTFDVVFHVAGIAHIKETSANQNLYYEINRDLAYTTALKAKAEGVKHFIFLSSMSVYGITNGIIDHDTPLNPKNAYGKSKMMAEELIVKLADDSFKVAVLRPPMVYGKGCKGNYPKLAKLVLNLPFFPKWENRRSMIYIDNLVEFIKLLIDHRSNGLFFPQNDEYVCTSDMVRLISKAHKKSIVFVRSLNFVIKIFRNTLFNKVFGDLIYDKKLSTYVEGYCICNFEDSILKTEV